MIQPYLFTKTIHQKGWGVFTSKKISVNTIIEVSPVIVMSKEEKQWLEKTSLYNYIFDWTDEKCCMGMGFISVYNHSYRSNCEYFQDYEANTIIIKTVKDIDKDAELTINYNGDWDNEKKVWFDVV